MSSTDSFKDFIVKNGIIATTAGITIGFATSTFVKSFVSDIIMPTIFTILVKSIGKKTFFAEYLQSKNFRLTNFISELVTWVLVVLAAWLVLGIAYKYFSSMKVSVVATNPFYTQQEQKPATQPVAHFTQPAMAPHESQGTQQPPKAPWEHFSQHHDEYPSPHKGY